MNLRGLFRACLVVPFVLLSAAPAFGRIAYDADRDPYQDNTTRAGRRTAVEIAGHTVGKIVLAVGNMGRFGIYGGATTYDAITGQKIYACEYPKKSNSRYLFVAAFWIGAVVGRDTLVSTGGDGWTPNMFEFYPDSDPFGPIVWRSITDPTKPEFDGAVSEQDLIGIYADTFTTSGQGVSLDLDAYNSRPHRPLGIKVTQRSFAWSYTYAEDFVLFDYSIENIGNQRLDKVYMGIYVDADVHHTSKDGTSGAGDDICGFLYDLPTPPEFSSVCEFRDTVNIAWIADADGDPHGNKYDDSSVPNVTATRIVRTPSDSLDVSFNWWISNGDGARDFGPQKGAVNRDMGAGNLGTPVGDIPKYFLLKNKEFDYDQVRTASIQPTDSIWLTPRQDLAPDVADGFDTRYLLSFGPFSITEGQKLPISFAYVGGERFHYNPDNAADNLPFNPTEYYRNISLADLGLNATWASWIYDNPGVDTDGDNYFGKYRICPLDSVIDRIDTVNDTVDTIFRVTVADTFWYEGDGRPDFKGASPPPAPLTWVYPTVVNTPTGTSGQIRVRFNGARSETILDNFSREHDFEGYRIYMARDERAASYMRLESYDRLDFNKWIFNPNKPFGAGYELKDVPYTLDSLRTLYAFGGVTDSTFDPLDYGPGNPYNNPFGKPGLSDSLFYFAPQDYNASDLSKTKIRKIYPDEDITPRPPDSLIGYSMEARLPDNYPDSLRDLYFTSDNRLKFYEYEYTIENLLPAVPYFINVTAFDYGSPKAGLGALETSVTFEPKRTYALPTADEVEASNLSAYVYPNPYRVDGGYRRDGFEGRGQTDRPDDRVRMIHFANLPAKCTIRIYTLDGDMVREIFHDLPTSDPTASHETWDLITRNTQLVVSGIYYWTVEAADGSTQIGKLVIIM
ncbi:MAG: hypothetical protein AB1644_11075 [Candidatus Zixiibacteriota bacterium]